MIKGITEENILKLSEIKKESDLVKNIRLEGFNNFIKMNLPDFGPKYEIDFQEVFLFNKIDEVKDWKDAPKKIQEEFKQLKVVESCNALSGTKIQYDSEMLFENLKEELALKKVIFTTIEEGFKKYPELVSRYFKSVVSPKENIYTALNQAAFSGGVFIYVPDNTVVERPLQSYFRIGTGGLGQFERTLIYVGKNSKLEYIEGCTAPLKSEMMLHSAVVEVILDEGAELKFITLQNWSKSVLNFVTERALLKKNAKMKWIDGNLGSSVNMKYPSCILEGDNSEGVCISIGSSSSGQKIDGGSNMIHLGKNTKSTIINKSIASDNSEANFRGKVVIEKSAINSESFVKCDSLLLGKNAKSDSYPKNILKNNSSSIIHEAAIKQISEENIYYLMTRGISLESAENLIMLGFLDEFKKELPVEYAVELNRLLSELL